MPSFYSVVQYVPDPIADERINIGVVAYSGKMVLVQFLSEWKRVKQFGGEDVGFIKDFTHRFQRAVARQVEGFPPDGGLIDADMIERMVGSWHNSIQFTPARASLSTPNALLKEGVQRFLSEPVRAAGQGGFRDHQAARNFAVSRIRRVVQSLAGDVAESLTRQRYSLQGDKAPHTFAVAVANGAPYLAAQAVSLEKGLSPQLTTSLDAIAWSVSDTRAQHHALPLGVLMLQARPTSPHFDEMERLRTARSALYKNLGADVLGEQDVECWAKLVLEGVLPGSAPQVP